MCQGGWMHGYSTGQVAERTGLSLDTLRYYERIGLLDGIARTAGGQRAYSDDDISWLNVLRCLRDTGMPIARMQEYADLARGGDDTVAGRISILEEHDLEIERGIRELRDQQAHLRNKVQYYRDVLAGS